MLPPLWTNRQDSDGSPSLEHFREFVAKSAGERTDLLASLDDRKLAEIHRDLGGRPRLAQLFDAIIESGSEDLVTTDVAPQVL